jgi:hypothetical protein
VDEIDNSLQRIGVGGGKNAMSEVENMSRTGTCCVKDAAGGGVKYFS